MGQRNLRSGSSAECGSYTGNDFVWSVGAAQGFDLFSRPSKDQRIAALQAYDTQTRGCQGDHQIIDLALKNFLLPAALADVVNLRCGRNQIQDLRRDEVVMQHGVGGS